jgi:hypothetical protein
MTVKNLCTLIGAFTFKAPEGATKVDLDSDVMMEFDEIPPGTAAGAKK